MNAVPAMRQDDCTAPLEEDLPQVEFSPQRNLRGLREADLDSPVPDLWEPGTVIGHRYCIGRVLGLGGMATVYEATQLDLVRPVAIKVPRSASADSPRARRFEREARTLAELQHPHIVSVFELGRTEESVSFMAMEFIEGPSLRAHLATEGALPWRQAVMLTTQLAEALACAHDSGVVHGDVSARNVLLLRRGDALESKLIDFGAARKVDDLPQHVWGTRYYVAPELFEGQAPHVPSDVYALGALLKEMVGDALGASPASLQALIVSMMDVDPRGRPGSAAEVASRLRDVLAMQSAAPTSIVGLYVDPDDGARHRSVTARLSRPSRGRGAAYAAGLAGVLLCVASAYGYRRSSEAPEILPAAVPEVSLRDKTASLTEVRFAQPPQEPSRPAEPQKVSAVRPAESQRPEKALAPAPAVAPVTPRPPALARPPAVRSPEVATKPMAVAGSAAVDAPPNDESTDRDDVIASLDRWFEARNVIGDGESESRTATRVGEPVITFDPRGTSASVSYRALVMYSNAGRGSHDIVEEHVFFAKHDDEWRIVDAEG